MFWLTLNCCSTSAIWDNLASWAFSNSWRLLSRCLSCCNWVLITFWADFSSRSFYNRRDVDVSFIISFVEREITHDVSLNARIPFSNKANQLSNFFITLLFASISQLFIVSFHESLNFAGYFSQSFYIKFVQPRVWSKCTIWLPIGIKRSNNLETQWIELNSNK